MASMTKIYHHDSYPMVSPGNPNNDQSGRTVLITGSSSGIGYGIAQAFIQANASRVIILGRRAETIEKAAEALKKESKSTEVLFRIFDINDDDDIERLWASFTKDQITIDVLVLNAAETSTGPIYPLTKSVATLRTAFKLNFHANILMSMHFLDTPNESRNASDKPKALLNVSTFMCHSNPTPHQAVYSTSKNAFTSLVQHLAEEVTSSHCQIVSFHPGAIFTDAVKKNIPPSLAENVDWDRGAFSVWATTASASFLHGRFVWTNWDLEELAARKSEFEDPGFLKLGLQGAEHVSVLDIFDKLRSKEAK